MFATSGDGKAKATSIPYNRSLMTPQEIARSAKAAFEASQLVNHSERIQALESIRVRLAKNKYAILAANRKDVEVKPILLCLTPRSAHRRYIG